MAAAADASSRHGVSYMHTYRLIIRRHDRLLGHFESDAPWSLDAVKDIATRLSERDGYRLELLMADGEKRLLESTPRGIRALSIEKLFRRASLDL